MAKIIPLTGLSPNSSYSISVRGKSEDGLYTPWSQFNTFTTAADSIAPSTPSAPTISIAGPQNVVVTHPLTKSGGGILDKDVIYLEVYITNSQVGATETYAGNIPIGPLATTSVSQSFFYPVPSNPSSITAKARVKAVDSSGNRSAYSAYSGDSSSIPYFDAAYITDLTVSSLSADKITTGTLAANVAISVGSTSPIVIKSNAASPHGQMYLGTGTYNNANTPFYVDSTNKFSLGSGLTWDGTTLNITGNGTFSGTVNASQGTFTGFVTAGTSKFGVGAFTVSSTNYNGISINSTNFWGINGSTVQFQVGNATNYIQWSPGSSLLSVKGNIVATGGSFTDYLTAGSVYIGANITIGATTGYNGLYLNSTNFLASNGTTASDSKFQIGDTTTYMKWTGTGLEISGNITSTATITGGKISTGTGRRIEISSSQGSLGIAGIDFFEPLVGNNGSIYTNTTGTSPYYPTLNIAGPYASISVQPSLQLEGNLGQFIFSIGSSGERFRISTTGTSIYGLTTIFNGSNVPVEIQDQTPTGVSNKSVRNIFITSGATPVGNGGDVWLVYA